MKTSILPALAYAEDGITVMQSTSGNSLDRFRKKLIKHFQDNEQKITVETGNTSINLLDMNYCLNS